MNLITVFLPFIVAILGLAYPIILQVISRLDDKYGSDITELFRKEKEYKWFIRFLKISLVSVLIYFCASSFFYFYPTSFSFPVLLLLKFIIFNSTIALLISFFLLIDKMLNYFSLEKLTDYLIQCDKKTNISEETLYIKALKSIFLYSIRQQDNRVIFTLSSHLFDKFHNFRELNKVTMDAYPEYLYRIVYEIADESKYMTDNKSAIYNHRAFSGVWLIGYSGNFKIHETTYSYLWHILMLAIEAKRDDLVIDFWKNSFNYFKTSLWKIELVYEGNTNNVLNKEEIENREKERNRFLEFHYALGGLLMYRERYKCISRFFYYTMSEPPDFVLLPNTIGDVFKQYIHFYDPYERNIFDVHHTYPFPDLEGLKPIRLIKFWIRKYIAVLFLRQYTLVKYYYFQEFLALPNFPENLSEKRLWLEVIEFFNKMIEELLLDKETLIDLGFNVYDFISEEWCSKNNKTHPLELIADFKQKLILDINYQEINQTLDAELINKFKETTTNILSTTIDEYKPIINSTKKVIHPVKWSVKGHRAFFDREDFIKGVVTHLNFDSFLAASISSEFKRTISETFYFQKTKSYLFKEEDIFKAIDKLNLSIDNHIIISFGNDYFLKRNNIDKDYNGIPIHNFEICHHILVGSSFFIIAKSDLPFIEFSNNKNEIENFKLEIIDEPLNLYARIIDLKEREGEEIVKLLKEDETSIYLELDKKVLAYISFNANIVWESQVNLVQLSLYSEFKQKGLPNTIDEIEKFAKESK